MLDTANVHVNLREEPNVQKEINLYQWVCQVQPNERCELGQ